MAERSGTDTQPTETVWRCTDCGREHQKNAPPCSRCGGLKLEQTTTEHVDVVDGGGLLPRWTDSAVKVVGVLVVLALVTGGVVGAGPLAGTLDTTVDPPEAPGTGATASGIDLSDAEREVVEQFNGERVSAADLTRRDDLDRIAEYITRYRVAEGEWPTDPESFPTADCQYRASHLLLEAQNTIGRHASETDLAATIANSWIEYSEVEFSSDTLTAVGVDIYVGPADAVYVALAIC